MRDNQSGFIRAQGVPFRASSMRPSPGDTGRWGRLFENQMRNQSMNILTFGLVVSVFCGCASSAVRGTEPDDMSAREHRAEAKQHSELAQSERAQFDSTAKANRVWPFEFPVVRRIDADSSDLPARRHEALPVEYNPTESHRAAAREHEQHVQQHRDAARELEGATAQACLGLPPVETERCPLYDSSVTIELTNQRAVVRAESTEAVGQLARKMRCHLAVARETHYHGTASCPLFVPHLSLQYVAGELSIVLTSDDQEALALMLKRMGSLSEASPKRSRESSKKEEELQP